LGRYAQARGWRLSLSVRDALAGPHEVSRDVEGTSPQALLVLGNPPWSARGRGPAYVERLLEDFHRDAEGRPLGERRRGVLADAYVRFVRWAMDAVERAPGGGALVLVTNASYLDGPVHRGVRAALLARFDEVSVIDLGGSALVARAPGQLDGNVFGVRPGAAILLAARGPRARGTSHVSFRALRGSAEEKLQALAAGPRDASVVRVQAPVASFRPRTRVGDEYERWPSLPEWIPFHAEGVQSNRDDLVVAPDEATLHARLAAVADGSLAAPARPHFDPAAARRAVAGLRDRGQLAAHVHRIAYRPFDTRVAFLHPSLCHRPRPALLAAMARSGLVLVSVRQDRGGLPWAHAALVAAVVDNCYLSARSSCRARAFPARRPDGTPNLAAALVAALRARAIDAEPEDVLAYLAGVLASPAYAARFAPALALDYARVPVPPARALFDAIAAGGHALARALAGAASPRAARAGLTVVRVGHHAFDPDAPAVVAWRTACAGLEEPVAALLARG
jgi:predicted helicase